MHPDVQSELETSHVFVKTLAELSGDNGQAHNPPTDKEVVRVDQSVSASAEPWPILAEDALYGLMGDIVRAIDPYTEADPVAVLVTLLVMFGNAIGTSPYFRVEFTKHFLRFFVALVGRTAKGRKGQSLSTPRHLFSQIDPEWTQNCVRSPLSLES